MILQGIAKGLHPEVAANAAGLLTEEFQAAVSSDERLRRKVLRAFARYEWSRAELVDRSHDPRIVLAYLERCRKNWSQKVSVDLKAHAKRAFDRLERQLLQGHKDKLLTGEQAYDLVLQCFNADGAEQLFE
jgi:hypothetical protein